MAGLTSLLQRRILGPGALTGREIVSGAARLIGILSYENVTMTDVVGPADLFRHANRCGAEHRTVLPSPTPALGLPTTSRSVWAYPQV
jgi:hypothetical protein